jgi:hypothetical protein
VELRVSEKVLRRMGREGTRSRRRREERDDSEGSREEIPHSAGDGVSREGNENAKRIEDEEGEDKLIIISRASLFVYSYYILHNTLRQRVRVELSLLPSLPEPPLLLDRSIWIGVVFLLVDP